jgi:hypothetical protein
MKDVMKRLMVIAMVVGSTISVAHGQAIPAGVSEPVWNPTLPSFNGTLHYSLTASEVVQKGFYSGGDLSASTGVSGNIGYSTTSERLPFNLLFAGGVFFPNGSVEGQSVSEFVDVAVSQAVLVGRWSLSVSDSLNYLPESPTTGLSGVAGVGDIGSLPISNPAIGPAGGTLTNVGSRLGNVLTGSAQRQITGATSISAGGSWGLLHFVDANDGIDSTQVSGNVSVNHRIDARDSASVNGTYSSYTYGLEESAFHTTGVNFVFQRSLSRSLSGTISVGPEWISGVPTQSSVIVAVNAGLMYTRKNENFSLNYSHGVNAGSGVQPGAVSNSVYFGMGRSIGEGWLASVSGGYVHSTGVAEVSTPFFPSGSSSSFFGGLQVSHSFSRRFSGYASYTAQDQSVSQSLEGQNVFIGVGQTFGIGISYTPQSTRLGEF